VIRWGTTHAQTVVEGTLADIVERAEHARLAPPVVTVIGDVVALRSRLDWFGARAGGAAEPDTAAVAGPRAR
jgi:siroheme synthase